MKKINSYPSIYQIGHKAILDIFKSPVVVEEKIDGSQFSFGMIEGEIYMRSKRSEIHVDNPEKMFKKAAETVNSIAPLLTPGYYYRAEYLQKPKHNTIYYERTPDYWIILFDIQTGIEVYMTPEEKKTEADRVGLECVPVLFEGIVKDLEHFNKLLEMPSILGGMIEGLVVKNYDLFTREKKIAIGKYVSEKFKEVHSGEWKKANPTRKDIIAILVESFRTDARWQKAVQHLRDDGGLLEAPQDIGNLMKEVSQDVEKECQEDIKDILYKHFRKDILRGVTRGLPEWYKQQLAEKAFAEEAI
jgi:hypothetical protein